MNNSNNTTNNVPNVSVFFETLARILSEKYGAEITLSPIRKEST